MGRLGRQLNQQRGISWTAWGMPEISTGFLVTTDGSGAARMHCWLLAPHLHSDGGRVCTFAPISAASTSHHVTLIGMAKSQSVCFFKWHLALVASTIYVTIANQLALICRVTRLWTHLLAGHLASHLRKAKHKEINVKRDGCLILIMPNRVDFVLG